MVETQARLMADELATLREATPAQVGELLQAMEAFDRAGGSSRDVILPPTISKYVEPLYETPQVIQATLTLQPGMRPDLLTDDSYVAPLQSLVYTVELPVTAKITEDGRFGNPRAIFTYIPLYPLPGKKEDHEGLFLERSGVVRQPGLSGGATNAPLEEVVYGKTGIRLFPRVSYLTPGSARRKGQLTHAQVLHYNHRMASTVGPQEAQEVIANLRAATPRKA